MTQTKLRTMPRSRRTALGLVFASVVLGGSLTACGSEAENTTCGEFREMSTDESLDLIKGAAEDDGSDSAKEIADLIDNLADEEKDGAADGLKEGACGGKDDDTKLGDTELYEN